MIKKKVQEDFSKLVEAMLLLESKGECESFLVDLCTPMELEAMSERWKVARLLDEGLSYRKINELTSISTTTITRVARSLNDESSGYKKVLKKLKKEKIK